MKGKKLLRLGCLLILTVLACAACAPGKAPDYADQANWAYYGIGEGKDADLFLICPTVDMGRKGNDYMSLSDEKTKESFVGALNMERGIYEDSLTMYAPYYRQVTFPVYSYRPNRTEAYLDVAYRDVRSAFLAFLERSGDRPIVLAGFSQGADMALRLLKEFFGDPARQERLVAAYCIGWRVTDEDLAACPWLKLAEGEDDTGVIVCFSSEAPDVTESLIVPKGVKTHGINPLNWRTDGTPARAEDNLGACFTNYDGEIKEETAGLTGAYLDESRGTLKLPDVDPANYRNSLFPDGVYHLYDYQFFFRNLQANVADRLAAYQAENVLADAA